MQSLCRSQNWYITFLKLTEINPTDSTCHFSFYKDQFDKDNKNTSSLFWKHGVGRPDASQVRRLLRQSSDVQLKTFIFPLHMKMHKIRTLEIVDLKEWKRRNRAKGRVLRTDELVAKHSENSREFGKHPYLHTSIHSSLLPNRFNHNFVKVAIYSGEVSFHRAPGNKSQSKLAKALVF